MTIWQRARVVVEIIVVSLVLIHLWYDHQKFHSLADLFILDLVAGSVQGGVR